MLQRASIAACATVILLCAGCGRDQAAVPGKNPGAPAAAQPAGGTGAPPPAVAPPAPVVITASETPRICWEAESAQDAPAPFTRIADSEASGGAALEIPDKANGEGQGGQAVPYQVQVPREGDYDVWVRAWWLDGCGNSCIIKVDSGPAGSVLQVEDNTYRVWKWRKAGIVHLTAGAHACALVNREDGVKIDQLLLALRTPGASEDEAYEPVGAQKAGSFK